MYYIISLFYLLLPVLLVISAICQPVKAAPSTQRPDCQQTMQQLQPQLQMLKMQVLELGSYLTDAQAKQETLQLTLTELQAQNVSLTEQLTKSKAHLTQLQIEQADLLQQLAQKSRALDQQTHQRKTATIIAITAAAVAAAVVIVMPVVTHHIQDPP